MSFYANRPTAYIHHILQRRISELAKKDKPAPLSTDAQADSYYREAELVLAAQLGRKVKVNAGKGKGTIVLEFYGKEDPAGLVNMLSRMEDM